MNDLQKRLQGQFDEMVKPQLKKVVQAVEESECPLMARAMVMDWVTNSGKIVQIQIVAVNHKSEEITPFDLETTTFQSVEEFMASKGS